MSLGDELKKVRMVKGLTLREVEKLTGISNGYLNQLENNKVKKPSPHYLHKLAQAYELPYDKIMEKAGYVAPKENTNSGVETENSLPSFALYKIEDLTEEEKEKIAEYIRFLRSQRKSK